MVTDAIVEKYWVHWNYVAPFLTNVFYEPPMSVTQVCETTKHGDHLKCKQEIYERENNRQVWKEINANKLYYLATD